MMRLGRGSISAPAHATSDTLGAMRPASIRRSGPFRQSCSGDIAPDGSISANSERASRPAKVLYVIGFARSGTTILGNLLNEIDGFFNAGELCYFWQRCFPPRPNAKCGCWSILPQCPLWSAVLTTIAAKRRSNVAARHAAEPQMNGLESDLSEMPRIQRSAERCVCYWHPVKGIVPRVRLKTHVQSYLRVQTALYQAIREHTGANVIVDTSKLPNPAVLLNSMTDIDAYFIHMVRDPRAVFFSRQRRRMQSGRDPQFDVPLLALDASRYMRDNLYAEAILRRVAAARRMRISYERFVADPSGTIQRIVNFVGQAVSPLPFVEPNVARLTTNHTVRANRSRFVTGSVPILGDETWRDALGPFDRLLSTMLAAPLLLRYGYPFGVRHYT